MAQHRIILKYFQKELLHGECLQTKASTTHYNAQLELADKGRAIKESYASYILNFSNSYLI